MTSSRSYKTFVAYTHTQMNYYSQVKPLLHNHVTKLRFDDWFILRQVEDDRNKVIV